MSGIEIAVGKGVSSAKGFREKLRQRQTSTGSLLCVGLDPLPEKLPKCLR